MLSFRLSLGLRRLAGAPCAAIAALDVPSRALSSWPPHYTLTMPSLSPTMEKGNLSKWTKSEVSPRGTSPFLSLSLSLARHAETFLCPLCSIIANLVGGRGRGWRRGR